MNHCFALLSPITGSQPGDIDKRHNVSNKKMKSHCSNVVINVDGTILEASPVSTTVICTGRMLDVQESVDLSVTRKELDENALRQTFKGVWSHLSVNGGYSVKLHYVRTPSSANYYPIVVDVTNSSGQMNIYISKEGHLLKY